MAGQCTDKVVGNILAGWRYDISGITPEMRGDYQAHFDECARCRSKRSLHRTIDFALLFIAKLSALVFVAAFLAVRYFLPKHALMMEIGAVIGVLFSGIVWIIVCMTTPVPVMVFGVVKDHARKIHEKLPDEIKARIPDTIAAKISSQ